MKIFKFLLYSFLVSVKSYCILAIFVQFAVYLIYALLKVFPFKIHNIGGCLVVDFEIFIFIYIFILFVAN